MIHTEATNGPELELMDMICPSTELLPFPLKTAKRFDGKLIEIYEIPDNEKENVLNKLYPFTDIPTLETRLYDLHQEAKFLVHDYMVIRTDGKNYLVSPYYLETGGTVLDWLCDEDEKDDDSYFVKTVKTIPSKPE